MDNRPTTGGHDGWMHQGRQDHGWFGHGAGLGASSATLGPAQAAAVVGQRIQDIGHTLIAGLPASKRHHDATRLNDNDRARLTRLLTAAVQALPLGLPGMARRVFGKAPDTPGIDGFAQAAGLLRDGRDNADLRAATDALGKAAQDIGLDHFKGFLREADERLAERGGLAVLVRDMPAPAPPTTKTPVRMPPPPALGRMAWGSVAAGVAAVALPTMSELIQREVVASTPLPRVGGPWLSVHISGEEGAPIPGEIADKLIGQHFSSFRDLRQAFWKLVAQTPELAAEFQKQNLRAMLDGNAPRPPESEQVLIHSSGKLSDRTFELHHDPAIG